MTAGGPWRGEDMSGPHRTVGDSVSRGCSAPPMLPEARLEMVSRGWWSLWRGGHRELAQRQDGAGSRHFLEVTLMAVAQAPALRETTAPLVGTLSPTCPVDTSPSLSSSLRCSSLYGL